ncbi:MAG: hypothetical protein IPF58_06980 [Saprospirales bacterium]|nr:hypothetical protein [Saprospirales bacterium]
MQKLILLFVAFLTINATYGKTDNAAIDYNDRIVTEQNKIGNQILAFTEEPSAASLAGLQKQANASLAVLNEMKPFEKNSELLNAAKALFQFYIDVTNNEYAKVLALLNESSKYSQEELVERINIYVASISQKKKNLTLLSVLHKTILQKNTVLL